MKIKILTSEESKLEWEKRKEYNRSLSREQVKELAISLPKNLQGNTDYLIGENEWNEFYEWITTDEGYQSWLIHLDLLDYIKNYSFKKLTN